MKPAITPSYLDSYSEQDTADKLILPYLAKTHGFPTPDGLDYQAQHAITTEAGKTGRYDGLYLSGGYPYAVLEAKRYVHDLEDEDFQQARSYATSEFFDKPVPFLVISNGRSHQFYRHTTTINPADQKSIYVPIPAMDWAKIILENPGEVKQLLSQAQLLSYLRTFKQRSFDDIANLFTDPATGKFDLSRHALGTELGQIITARRNFIGVPVTGDAAISNAIQAVAIHFTIKILFIKLIEDLARGPETPLAQDLARVSWQDIFRYGFNVHMERYGQLFSARHYDRFLPSDTTLQMIREALIQIDIRTAIIYGSATNRTNVIGNLYEKLIDNELRSSLGAVYTPDETMRFMVDLGNRNLGSFRGRKIVEPACGSGHFYREIYRRYVGEVKIHHEKAGMAFDAPAAHTEALEHVYGRDIDPFAVQLTLLSAFLEQLKDNVRPGENGGKTRHRWLADRSIDTQNSLDPITIDPTLFFDIEKTADLTVRRSLRASCQRAATPDLMIGNPPYGVKVVKGAHYDDVYRLRSPDSYGYFIANAINRLPDGRRMIYVVSSSFLTIGTHKSLRALILSTCKIVRVIKLHRSTFPGIDIFPAIVELERCSDATQRAANYYQFYDLWRLRPDDHQGDLNAAYAAILNDLSAKKTWPFEGVLAKRYTVRQGLLVRYSKHPIFEGLPSLYAFMADVAPTADAIELARSDGSNVKVRFLSVRGRKVVKLSDIGEVKIGLQSGDNGRFYRVVAGVQGGATKGGYKKVSAGQIVRDAELAAMTTEQRANGLEVDDPSHDRFFVPLDKAGASDIDGGLLPLFWRPVEFYIDWSKNAVSEMKALKGAVFRNPHHYFRRGISFSNTGIYSPTYRLGHGGVFDQTGSNIFCEVLDQRVLLGILCSTLMRYFIKSFINHGVHAQLDDVPIVITEEPEGKAIAAIVDEIIMAQKMNASFDYRPKLAELDVLISELYVLRDVECEELQSWYKRHYPRLT